MFNIPVCNSFAKICPEVNGYICTLTRFISFLTGKLVDATIPFFLREKLYRGYSFFTGAKIDECELPLAAYESLAAFFARKLRNGIREIQGPICSPVDGTVSTLGKINDLTLIQAKGKVYSVGELCGDGAYGANFVDGSYITIYLAPGDYHRVHSPSSGEIVFRRHIAGALIPVSKTLTTLIERLFSRNERVVIAIENSDIGSSALVFVGALNVGSISITASKIRTNNSFREVYDIPAPKTECLPVPLSISAGDELGVFNLGSTVVVLFSKDFAFEFGVVSGQKVKMGQSLIK